MRVNGLELVFKQLRRMQNFAFITLANFCSFREHLNGHVQAIAVHAVYKFTVDNFFPFENILFLFKWGSATGNDGNNPMLDHARF